MKVYSRRQLMMEEARVKPYISDGLVFHLDGRDYDHESKIWKDRIKGLEFTIVGTTISTDGLGGVYFNGNDVSTLHNFFSIPALSCTLEVVYDKVGAYASIFNTGNGSWIGYRRVNNNVWIYTGSVITVCPKASGKATHAVQRNGLSIFNGQSLGWTSGSTYYTRGTNSDAYLGRDNNNQYRMVGNIYQIRIYNRRLSLDEIAYNQEQDKKRYGIIF